jgi:hypothetical protein
VKLTKGTMVYVPMPDKQTLHPVALGDWISRVYGSAFTDESEAWQWMLSQVRSSADDLRREADEMEARVLAGLGRGDGGADAMSPTEREETVVMLCLNCQKPHTFALDSLEARGIFNVFCDGECEDTYAARL